MNPELWIDADQQVNVIRHDFELFHFGHHSRQTCSMISFKRVSIGTSSTLRQYCEHQAIRFDCCCTFPSSKTVYSKELSPFKNMRSPGRFPDHCPKEGAPLSSPWLEAQGLSAAELGKNHVFSSPYLARTYCIPPTCFTIPFNSIIVSVALTVVVANPDSRISSSIWQGS